MRPCLTDPTRSCLCRGATCRVVVQRRTDRHRDLAHDGPAFSCADCCNAIPPIAGERVLDGFTVHIAGDTIVLSHDDPEKPVVHVRSGVGHWAATEPTAEQKRMVYAFMSAFSAPVAESKP